MQMDYWQGKMRRADEHLESLDLEIDRLIQSCVGGIQTQERPDGDLLLIRRILGSAADPSSEALGQLVGDFYQALRSSLDHLVNVLTWDHTDESSEGTAFPVFKDGSRYGRRYGGGPYQIRDIDPDAQAIIESLQPYNLGEDAETHPLWLIHKLANLDEHSTTPWSWVYARSAEPRVLDVTDMEIVSIETPLCEGPVNIGTKFSLITSRVIGEHPSMEFQDRIEFEVRFGAGTIAAGKSVTELSHALRDYVKNEVFPKFERFHRSPVIVSMSESISTEELDDEDKPWLWADVE